MVVAWTRFLLEICAGRNLFSEPEDVADLAHRAEVLEFREPGGKMDHYTSALGGTVWIQFKEGLKLNRLTSPPGTFVLGDSLEKKDTTGTLGSVRERVTRGLEILKKEDPELDLASASEQEILRLCQKLPPEIRNPLHGAVLNRILTGRAETFPGIPIRPPGIRTVADRAPEGIAGAGWHFHSKNR